MKCTLSYPVADIYEIWRSLRRNRHISYLWFFYSILNIWLKPDMSNTPFTSG